MRPAQPTDVPGILALIQGVFDEYGLIFDPHGFDTHLLAPGEYFRSHGGEFWVVEATDGAIVATAAVRVGSGIEFPRAADADADSSSRNVAQSTNDPDPQRVAELKSLYVAARLRRQGWARRLVQTAIDFARRANCTHFVAWSDTLFEPAHALYRAMAFTQIGRHPIHDGNESWEYGFVLPIGPNARPTDTSDRSD